MTNSIIEHPENFSQAKIWFNILQEAYLKGKMPDTWPELTSDTQDLKKQVEDLLTIQKFISNMTEGDLTSSLKVDGVLADSLRSLQSNLHHITWQMQQVAAGDLTQHIEFIGDLASAFNQMIQKLKKARAELLESEARYRLLAENAVDVIWTMNLDGEFTYISPSVMHLRGFTVEEAMAQSIEESLAPASAQLVREKMNELMVQIAQGEKIAGGIFQLDQPRKDGSMISIEVSISGLYDLNGILVGIQGSSRDITERLKIIYAEQEQRILAEALKNTAAALNSAMSLEDVFDCLLENIGHVVPHDTVDILTVDRTDHASVKRSEGYQKFIPDARPEIIAMSLPVEGTFNLKTMRDSERPFLINELSDLNWVETEATRWARSHLGTPILVKGKVVGFIILLSTVPGFFSAEQALHLQAFADLAAVAIEKADLYEQLNELATIDSLTGIANRRHFFNLAETELARAVRYNRPLAALMMDVDNFKQVNDSYGHSVGDDVLVEIVHRCQQELRSNDLFGRYGGEEFSFILPETNSASALIVADRLRKLIANKPFYAHNEAFKVTVSIGVTDFKASVPSARALLDQADQALYFSKQSGRNKVAKLG